MWPNAYSNHILIALWQDGYKNPDGYGHLTWKNETWRAHRLAYHLQHGEIPGDMCVMHTCDQPACINPEHLKLGTHAEHMADMRKKGRCQGVNVGQNNGAAKLKPNDVLNIRRRYGEGDITQAELAHDFGVTQTTIGRIVNGEAWPHLNDGA